MIKIVHVFKALSCCTCHSDIVNNQDKNTVGFARSCLVSDVSNK